MASIETRTGPKGTSHRVVWRADGKKRVRVFKSNDKALVWKGLIEDLKGDEAAAKAALARRASKAKTVQMVSEHRLGLMRGTEYTKQTYQRYMRLHIGPALGSWPIDTVGEDDCRRFVLSLEAKKLSPKSVRNICGWLTSVMNHAVDRGWRSGNPMKHDMLPDVERSDEREADMFLTIKEARSIIDHMPEPYQDPARLMLATGLRPGEWRALTVADAHIDDKQPSVRVTKAVKEDREKGEYLGSPKSKRSVRSCGIAPTTVSMLRAHVKGRKSDERLFPDPDGMSDWMRDYVFYGAFKAGVRGATKAGELSKNPSPYSLRHTHASLMLDAGMDLWKLSRHMGHGSQAVTETVYAHLMPDAQFQAAQFAATFTDSPAAITS